MSRKLGHIILTVLVLLSTTGIVVSKHYCNEALVSTSVYSEAESCCDDASSCCNSVVNFYQVEDDFNTHSFNLPVVVKSVLLFSVLEKDVTPAIITENHQVYLRQKPPRPLSVQKRLSFIQSYLI